MVAEDDLDNLELFVFALRKAGFVAHGVESVAQAKEAMSVVRPDVLVADYTMGDGTGVDVLQLCADARPLDSSRSRIVWTDVRAREACRWGGTSSGL